MSSRQRDSAGKRPLRIQVRGSGCFREQVAQELWCRRQEHDKIIVALTREHNGLVAALRRKEEGKPICPPLRVDLKRLPGIHSAAVRLIME